MSIAAKVSSNEVDSILRGRYVDQVFEARLINLPAFNYDPATAGSDATLLAGEVTPGTGGYRRATFKFTNTDVGNYADGGVPLAQKATVFAHDGGTTPISFSHVALVWSNGYVLSLENSAANTPSAGVNGTYTNIPADATSGTGAGATVDLVITNNGTSSSDYAAVISSPGYGYAIGDTLTIDDGTLAGLGAISPGAGGLTVTVESVGTSDGALFTAVKTSSVVNLVDGNEAAFYWNVKQFGFYSNAAA